MIRHLTAITRHMAGLLALLEASDKATFQTFLERMVASMNEKKPG